MFGIVVMDWKSGKCAYIYSLRFQIGVDEMELVMHLLV